MLPVALDSWPLTQATAHACGQFRICLRQLCNTRNKPVHARNRSDAANAVTAHCTAASPLKPKCAGGPDTGKPLTVSITAIVISVMVLIPMPGFAPVLAPSTGRTARLMVVVCGVPLTSRL
jgi:hypothetical protein